MKTYVIKSGNSHYYKIGKTSRSVESRLRELQTGNPHSLKVIKVLSGDLEGYYHNKFSHKRVGGEWFKLSHRDLKQIREIQPNASLANKLFKLALWGSCLYLIIRLTF
jgi:hypothetical protein